MGNTNVREGQAIGGRPIEQGNVHAAGQRGQQGYGVAPLTHLQPQGQQMRGPGRLGHAASSESMGQSPSDSPGSAARSPLMFTPQVRSLVVRISKLGFGWGIGLGLGCGAFGLSGECFLHVVCLGDL